MIFSALPGTAQRRSVSDGQFTDWMHGKAVAGAVQQRGGQRLKGHIHYHAVAVVSRRRRALAGQNARGVVVAAR